MWEFCFVVCFEEKTSTLGDNILLTFFFWFKVAKSSTSRLGLTGREILIGEMKGVRNWVKCEQTSWVYSPLDLELLGKARVLFHLGLLGALMPFLPFEGFYEIKTVYKV